MADDAAGGSVAGDAMGGAAGSAAGKELPPEFMRHIAALEPAYLLHGDPIRQSGFSGGAERWRAERSPILDAIDADGDLLDIGCANGYLLECLLRWGLEDKGLRLVPHGLDIGSNLIALARRRHPEHADNFHVGNAWDWRPARRYRYAYMLYDCLPLGYLAEGVGRLLAQVVEPGGRLIIGAYGSRSAGTAPFDIGGFLAAQGFTVAGHAEGGAPVVTKFCWLDG